MTQEQFMTVSAVAGGSIALKKGLEPGDRLVSINDKPVSDIIDFYLLTSDPCFQIKVRKKSGETRTVEVKNRNYENLGITFAEDIPGGIRECANKCVFCFIHQLPGGLRDTLYVKDDDYRHSFLYGNYISLTNLSSADWERIIRMHLSPLYISVHTTNPELRSKMFGNPKAAGIMEQLKTLVDAGITLYVQVVVCPGINDGQELENTLRDLGALWPSVSSIAVVPVGITKYQRFELPFSPVGPEEAREITGCVEKIQEEFRNVHGSNIVFAADELYLKAGRSIPPADYYEDFSQLENGVGLVRVFLDEFECLLEGLPRTAPVEGHYVVVTGISAAPILEFAAGELKKKVEGLDLEVLPVENRFFGETVTVSGLLTGQDIADALDRYTSGKNLDKVTALLPSVTLKAKEDIFLDDYTLDKMEKITGIDIKVVENSAQGLLRGILGLEV